MSQARVPARILSIAALCGCSAPADIAAFEPAPCAVAARASDDWGARATPPDDDWIELRGAGFASGPGPTPPLDLDRDCPAAISCSGGLVAESYRFEPESHTIDLMLKHYGETTLTLAQSAHVAYVLDVGSGAAFEHGELPLTSAVSLAPGHTLHTGGQVGTSTHVERVWARVRL